MGRHKSVLKARRGARDIAYHVYVPVPASGLGPRRDIIEDRLEKTAGNNWRQHGTNSGGVHVARYMFRTKNDADAFEAALRSDAFDEDSV